MGSKRAGNVKVVALFIFLSPFEFIAFQMLVGLISPDPIRLSRPGNLLSALEMPLLMFVVPTIFAFAFVPFMRRVGADYAPAAGASAAAFFSFFFATASSFAHARFNLLTIRYLLGPVLSFMALLPAFRFFHKVSAKPIQLIPAGTLSVWLVCQALQQIVALTSGVITAR